MPRPCVPWSSGLAAEALIGARTLVADVVSGVIVAFVLGHWMRPRPLGGDLFMVLNFLAGSICSGRSLTQTKLLESYDTSPRSLTTQASPARWGGPLNTRVGFGRGASCLSLARLADGGFADMRVGSQVSLAAQPS